MTEHPDVGIIHGVRFTWSDGLDAPTPAEVEIEEMADWLRRVGRAALNQGGRRMNTEPTLEGIAKGIDHIIGLFVDPDGDDDGGGAGGGTLPTLPPLDYDETPGMAPWLQVPNTYIENLEDAVTYDARLPHASLSGLRVRTRLFLPRTRRAHSILYVCTDRKRQAPIFQLDLSDNGRWVLESKPKSMDWQQQADVKVPAGDVTGRWISIDCAYENGRIEVTVDGKTLAMDAPPSVFVWGGVVSVQHSNSVGNEAQEENHSVSLGAAYADLLVEARA